MEVKVPIEEMRKRKLFLATPMYAGQCFGGYTKSVQELTALCARYGIELRCHFLFNESLITRARNYCADEFLRSDFTHFLFIDSDISFKAEDALTLMALMDDDSPYDVLAAPYTKKCLSSSTRIHTEDGIKTIAQVVREEYTGRVLSVDSDGRFVWKKVISHNVEPNLSGKRWVSVQTQKFKPDNKNRPQGSMIVTDDHLVAYVDDPFDRDIKYTEAKNLTGKWLVQTATHKTTKYSRGKRWPLFNREQSSAFLGSVIGDGHLDKNGMMHGSQTEPHVDYARHKANLFNGSFREGMQSNGKLKGEYSTCNPLGKYLRSKIYTPNGKTLRDVAHLIDEIALAYLYMDDGNRYHRYQYHDENSDHMWWYNQHTHANARGVTAPEGEGWVRGRDDKDDSTASIATMSFSKEDNELLAAHLSQTMGLVATVRVQRSSEYKKDYYYLHFDKENTKTLYRIIAPYIHDDLKYKLDPEYRDVTRYVISDESNVDFTVSEVLSVNVWETDSHLYDIGVEDTHNFVINDGVVVHNCIAWEKVITAVNKGVEDPEMLELVSGDFVFNAIDNKPFRLDNPAEVLETGTGFMMIRRQTFDTYKEHYPQYSYRPDHIRSVDFDGSKEIMAYFDCIIDPETKRYLSEDYFFCRNCRKAGMQVWIAPWIHLEHSGFYNFRGSLVELAKLGEAATVDPSKLKKKNVDTTAKKPTLIDAQKLKLKK